MTWRCVPVACWHKAPHIAAVAFGVLVAAHPMPAGVKTCRCKMVWYPDARALSRTQPPSVTHKEAFMSPVIHNAVPLVVHGPMGAFLPPVLGLPDDVTQAAQPSQPVPEPGTFVLVGTWLAVLMWMKRHNRRNTQ